MSHILARRADDRHPNSLDGVRPVMAKANVNSVDIDWQVALGRAIQRAVIAIGLSSKEAAGKANVDEAEFSRWLSGARRPQLDRLFAIPELRGPLVIALAELTGDVEVATVLTLRRRA